MCEKEPKVWKRGRRASAEWGWRRRGERESKVGRGGGRKNPSRVANERDPK